MADKAWKAYERKIATIFHGKRALEKGTDEKADIKWKNGDEMPWVIDVKLHKKLAIWKWMRDLVEYSRNQDKSPILVFRVFGKRGSFAVVEREWFHTTFAGHVSMFRLWFWKKFDMDTFQEIWKKATKSAGKANRMPGLAMTPRKTNDGYDFVCISVQNLQSLMKARGLFEGRDDL